MDPRLIDLMWEVNREVEGTQPIQIICGYRAEGTNTMLRRRTSGVAQNSLHKSGQAMDFAIPGVQLEKLRVAGLRLQRGGVGFYPSSGSPFVHMDVGGVRHWPRMSREQLARVFPNGRTVHIPSDGQPLAGYAVALADIERHGGSPSGMSIAAARRAGIDTDTAMTEGTGKPLRSLLARVFGAKEEHEAEETQQHAAPIPAQVAAARTPATPIPLPKVRPANAPIVVAMALPAMRSSVSEKAAAIAALAAPQPHPADRAAGTLSPNEIIRVRGYWVGVPELAARLAPVPDPVTTGSVLQDRQQRLAYAAEPVHYTTGTGQTRQHTVVMQSAKSATSIAVKASLPAPPQPNPWLNAVTITPSVWTHLSATQYGARDFRSLRPLLDKPATTLALGFSHDPHRGLSAERFTGRAVVFIGTMSFAAAAGDGSMQTVALR
jgi:hypothetical protein